MATNAPAEDGQRKGALRKRSQPKTKIAGKIQPTKRDKPSGAFMAKKSGDNTPVPATDKINPFPKDVAAS